MKNLFIYRKESFGYTKYNVETMLHEFVSSIDTQYIRYIELPKERYKNNGLLIAPIRIYIETTLKCNLKCPYCFNIVENNKELNTQEMLDAISLFHESGVIDLRFTGGEITTRSDWDKLLLHAKKLGFVFSINTNGVYKDINVLNKFIAINPNQITFSIDGIGDKHDKIRGNGSYDALINSMETLYNSGLNLRLNCTLSKHNIDDVDSILNLAKKYCNEIHFFGLREIGRGVNFNQSLTLDEFNEISNYLLSKNTKELYVCAGHEVMKDMSINTNQLGLNMGSPDLTTRFNITADGNYYSGGYLPYVSKKLALGNVLDKNNSLYQIWHNSKKLKEIRKASSKLKEECHNCEYYNMSCNGGLFELELQKRINNIENPYCKKDLNIFQDVTEF